jgi:hypothetical protein
MQASTSDSNRYHHGFRGAMLCSLLLLFSAVLQAEELNPEDMNPTQSNDVETVASADDAPPEITLNPVVSDERDQSCLRRDEAGRFQGWMDYHHCVFSGRTMATAQWFDDLFGDWNEDQAEMLLSVIGETGWDEEFGWSSAARIRARVDLPNASARLRLIVSDDGNGSVSTEAERSVPRGLTNLQESTSIALRWIPRAWHHIRSDIDVGVRGGPDVFLRLRLRRQWGLTDDVILKGGQTFRYGTESLGISTSQLEWERAMSEHAVLRIGTVYRFEENNHADGFLWSDGVSMSHGFHEWKDASLGYGVTVSGHTHPDYRKESYGPWLLWRQSFWRDWLYYEVEPRLTWYRKLNWDAVPSVVLRLEAQFGRYQKN